MHDDPAINPCQSLWQSVLLTAVEDAILGPINSGAKATQRRLCEEARSYLTRPSKDLAQVCALAGMDMQAVIEAMRIRIAAAPSVDELMNTHRTNRAILTKREPTKAEPKKPKPVPFKDRPYTINGTTCTAAEWCERYGIKIAAAQARLYKGWSAERALTTTTQIAQAEGMAKSRKHFAMPIAKQPRKRAASSSTPTYSHDGQSLTLTQWSEQTGIGKMTLYKRLRSGWSIADALTTPTRPKADAA